MPVQTRTCVSAPALAASRAILTKTALFTLALISAMPPALAQPAQVDPVWRVTSRLGYGPTEALAAQVQAQGGAKAWAHRQIESAYTASRTPPVIDPAHAQFNDPLPQISAAFRKEREERKAGRERDDPKAAREAAKKTGAQAPMQMEMVSRDNARGAVLWRLSACSNPETENPLLARMTEFWFNHFNVFMGKGPVRPYAGHYTVNAIRANALGRFEDLLLATAQHPAMLFYLDQAQSVAEGIRGANGQSRGLNENYARELLELHTLGVHGGYTQTDVRELARVLTGWTIGPNEASGFRFAPRLHDQGEKRVLGRVFKGGGINEGEEAIRMLARHPATAKRIATRLATFFVSDQPAPALIDRLARSFTASQGDMRTVLRDLVDAPEFWDASQTLFKTPYDFACSSLAALGGVRDPRDALITAGFLNNAGQPVMGWQTPDGYKTDAATWLAPEALTRRADYAMNLGRQAREPQFLNAYLSAATRNRIAQEPPEMRTGLMLASPDFMSK